jgi:hypothetical protein
MAVSNCLAYDQFSLLLKLVKLVKVLQLFLSILYLGVIVQWGISQREVLEGFSFHRKTYNLTKSK